MTGLEMVFRGAYRFRFDLLGAERHGITDQIEFEAVSSFGRLKLMEDDDFPAFSHVQAVCVTGIKDYGFRDCDFDSVLVRLDAVRWILCFPVFRRPGKEYVLESNAIKMDALRYGRIFFCFRSAVRAARRGAPIQAVLCLDDLNLLSPYPGDRLVLFRAKNWRWDEKQNTAVILLQDVIEKEVVYASEVRVL